MPVTAQATVVYEILYPGQPAADENPSNPPAEQD